MAKESKVQQKVEEQTPSAGGSFIRNEDGSLIENSADLQKSTLVEVTTEETSKE